ncbi:peptidoglycan/LPS O-acetylase OafA/YrhL [Citrobacter amalonaticus]|uniref:acyltransferase family protein n=1 Tax=Citrobacter amalonaticus TaxID=35703 RepID=UPI00209CD82F|nr:acyltransferase family protein [Citrobacter amalonaticus]MCP1629607.1 peptidoglycan/LPS O-acetylase OafA/YrhL [Citrobacter amalonaticus]
MKHSYHLDSLRGFLSLIVVMQHSAAAFLYSQDGTESIINTYLGLAAHFSVLMFFTLSGYVITISITENIKRHHRFVAFEYITSRALRILPPLIGVILLTAFMMLVLQYFGADRVSGDFRYYIRSLFDPDIIGQFKAIATLTIYGNLSGGASNVNGALWSLVYEIQFYVIAGLIATSISTKSILIKITCIISLLSYLYSIDLSTTLSISTIAFICFAFGSASYLLNDLIAKTPCLLIFALTITILTIGYQTDWSDSIIKIRQNLDRSGDWMYYKIPLGLFFALSLNYVGLYGGYLRWFNCISSSSYSLYITHFPIIVFSWLILSNYASHALNYKYLLSTGAIVLCVLFAKLFGSILEKPKQQRELLMRLIRF